MKRMGCETPAFSCKDWISFLEMTNSLVSTVNCVLCKPFRPHRLSSLLPNQKLHVCIRVRYFLGYMRVLLEQRRRSIGMENSK